MSVNLITEELRGEVLNPCKTVNHSFPLTEQTYYYEQDKLMLMQMLKAYSSKQPSGLRSSQQVFHQSEKCETAKISLLRLGLINEIGLHGFC